MALLCIEQLLTVNTEVSPQLPSGYATMILLALVPPLWFAVMNPRVMRIRAR